MNRKIQFTKEYRTLNAETLYRADTFRICQTMPQTECSANDDDHLIHLVFILFAMASVCNIVQTFQLLIIVQSKSQICVYEEEDIIILHDKLLIVINNLLAIFTFLSHLSTASEWMRANVCCIDRLHKRIYVLCVCVCL